MSTQSKYRLTSQLPIGANYPSMQSASTYLDFIQNRRGKLPLKVPQKNLFDTADEKMMRIKDIIWQISETNVPVLITGEPGVGKEVIAKAIHEASSHEEKKPFFSINCATTPHQILESDLFGFEKSTISGSSQRNIGKLEMANQGTVVLEEITEVDPIIQAKLLRVLQEKEIERSAGKTAIPIKTRIIATTSKDIVKAVSQGKFRQDLYYRLYVLHIEVPPLRDRPKDVELLATKFAKDSASNLGFEHTAISKDAMASLLDHNWPGNVKELQNLIHRAAILSNGGPITTDHLSLTEDVEENLVYDWVTGLPIGQTLRMIETQFILATLKHHRGNRTHAARTLGISLRTLRNKINEFNSEGINVVPPHCGKALT